MKKYSFIIIVLLLIASSCKKRNSKFSFAGVWEITKVEQVNYVDFKLTKDSVIVNDTLGWFALQNATGLSGQGKIQINFESYSGLKTDYQTFWEIDENNGDRIELNNKFYTRDRFVGGEKWTWVSLQNGGSDYSRETIFVKRIKKQ